MLNSHPAIACFGALFLPKGTGTPPAGAQDLEYFSARLSRLRPHGRLPGAPLLGWRFANEIFERSDEVEAIGFKFMYGQFARFPWLFAYFATKRVRVVHLVREDKLEHVLSREAAKARGKFHARPGEALVTPKLVIDPTDLVTKIAREETKVKRARALLSLLPVPGLEVAYEDLARDSAAFGRIAAFLGVAPMSHEFHSTFHKWSGGTYADRIENIDEVQAALQGTRYARSVQRAPGNVTVRTRAE
jgi:hypothetical protein